MVIRPKLPDDAAMIRKVTAAAFKDAAYSEGTEPAIIHALRATGALTISLVAEEDGEVVGHVAFSPAMIGGQEVGWFGRGPVSVEPSRQRRGIGGALIQEGLARLRRAGAAGCVVLGDPAYYGRFGFASDPRLSYAGVPPEYFQRLVFIGSEPAGSVTYQTAFSVR